MLHSMRYLELVLRIKDNDKTAHFIEVSSVMFFYPLGIIDKLIEDKKAEFQPYPTHTLILFNSVSRPNVLVCYIELFSTYQYYVVLSNSYSGSNIYKFYTQKILPEKEVVFEPYRQYYKERSSILSSLNISKKELENAYKNTADSKEEAEYKLITQKQNEQRYNISLETYLDSIIDTIMIEEVDKLSNETDLSVIKNLLDNTKLFYHINENNETLFNISSFRRYYIDSVGRKVDYVDKLFNEHKKTTRRNKIL